ncbi:MAG: 30S ribosomal protein S11 [Legionellales bacterium]|nr:30S ribosomal protein S11 [Legionellales bacterium]|tara:strand:+ start:85 stop:474 length:390 start_codon:yes stop_codon:yes gene_type:complete
MGSVQTSTRKSKKKLQSSTGKVFVKATYNNTIVTVATTTGDVIATRSAGQYQKGARKSTALAGEQAAKEVSRHVKLMGLSEVHVVICGPGHGRDSAVKGVELGGLKVLTITDVTGYPFNGCRPRKEKRV